MSTPKPHRFPVEPLLWDASDPLAAEHELVSQLVLNTLKTGWQYYTELDLNLTEPGRKILAADPEESARIAAALTAQVAHFDDLTKHARSLAKDEMQRINWHHFSPEWDAIWPPRQVLAQALRRVLRRKLPLRSEHLTSLATWISTAEWQNDSLYPLKLFVKAVENYGEIPKNETDLRASLSAVARVFRNAHEKELP